MVPVASGRVELDGQPLSERAGWERARRGVAWVPEGRRLFPHFTVEENLVAGSYHRRDRAMATRDLQRVYALFPALGERRDQLAKTLSGGEQQVCAIGRALMAAPRLRLVDEASLGLAPIMVSRVFAAIDALVRDGLTMLLVEQNARQALKTVSRAYVREAGRIVARIDGNTVAIGLLDRLRHAIVGPRPSRKEPADMALERVIGPTEYPVHSHVGRMLIAREALAPDAPKPRSLERVREALRTRHYGRRTEEAYVAWIRRYIFFHGKRHPVEMGGAEVTRFLSSLAVDGRFKLARQA